MGKEPTHSPDITKMISNNNNIICQFHLQAFNATAALAKDRVGFTGPTIGSTKPEMLGK